MFIIARIVTKWCIMFFVVILAKKIFGIGKMQKTEREEN